MKFSLSRHIYDYVQDHMAHFAAWPMDVQVHGRVYDWDAYWTILRKAGYADYSKEKL